MKASDIMTSPAYTIRDQDTVGDAARIMADKGIGTLPVVNEQDRIVGILSHTDFFLSPVRYPGAGGHLFDLLGSYVSPDTIEEVSKSVGERLVKEVMNSEVTTVNPDTSLADAGHHFLNEKQSCLLVTEDEKLVGMVTSTDFVRMCLKLLDEEPGKPAG